MPPILRCGDLLYLRGFHGHLASPAAQQRSHLSNERADKVCEPGFYGFQDVLLVYLIAQLTRKVEEGRHGELVASFEGAQELPDLMRCVR